MDQSSEQLETIGRCAGGIAHDFNNLITTIAGYGSLILQSLPEGSPASADVREILRASDRAGKLTAQLLAFSRRRKVEPRVHDLNELVGGIDGLLRCMAGDSVRLILDLSREPVRVRADGAQLERALMNLAVNARDAMPGGGTLTVSTRRSGDFIELVFADDGVGMSAEILARACDPYFTTKSAGKGTGLGLANVQGIVREHGGTLDLQSAPGRGAAITMRLPATDAPVDANAERTHQAAPSCPLSRDLVMLVEDDAALLSLVGRMLRGRGYRVLECGGAEAALALHDKHPDVRLSIIDVMMPGLDGASLFGLMRGGRPGLRALFISGSPDQEQRLRARAGAAVPFLAKPFTAEEFLGKVRGILDAPEPGPS